jgi:hypothetical protein
MPWQVIRDGSTLNVRINAPVGDWDRLASAIDAELEPRPGVVTLPVVILGGTTFDATMLRITWDELIRCGFAIYRETGEPSVPEPISVERSGSLYRWVCTGCGHLDVRWYVTHAGAEIAGCVHFYEHPATAAAPPVAPPVEPVPRRSGGRFVRLVLTLFSLAS